MVATSRPILAGLLAAFAAVTPAAAQPARPGSPSKTYAVLIGVARYADDSIKPRRHAESDVQALHDLVVGKDHFAADPRNVRLLLGGAPGDRKATRANILAAFRWLAEQAGPDDLALLAFFGQGAPLDSSGARLCYLAVDSTFSNRARDAVAASEVAEALKPLKCKYVCTFLDVNFKGFRGAAGTAEPVLGKGPFQEFQGNDGSGDRTPLPGRMLFMATNGLSPSLDLEKHGLFATALLDGLSGAADRDAHDGYEPDGLTTVPELMRYLDKEIGRLSRLHGTTMKEKAAPHYSWGGQQLNYVLCANPGAAPEARRRLERFERLVKTGTVAGKLAEEGRELLGRMPRLKARQGLRKAYKDLAEGHSTLAKFKEARDRILTDSEMPRPEAEKFARQVIEVTRVIKEEYVREVNQGEMVARAIAGLYRRIEEKIPEKIEVKMKRARFLDDADLTLLLADARQELGRREDLDNGKDVQFAVNRMLLDLDPYTTFMDQEAIRKYNADISHNFTGVGVTIRKDAASDYIQVTSPIKGSPAYKAGIYAGDLITAVTRFEEGKDKTLGQRQRTSTKGLTVDEVVRLVIGEAGTKVVLTIERAGVKEPFDVEITCDQVEQESVLGFQRKDSDDWDYLLDPKAKIGYVRLIGFGSNTQRDVEKAMGELKAQGFKGFVLDLRSSIKTDGYTNTAINITDLFIDDGLIVTVKDRPGSGQETMHTGNREGSLLNFPMVCLVNGDAGGCSEIVAAALQDHNRAVVVGERTAGVAFVLQYKDLEGDLKGQLKFTKSTFWRPNGKNLNKSTTQGRPEDDWGVVPDRIIALPLRERDELREFLSDGEIIQRPDRRGKANRNEFKDRQLDVALKYLRTQIR